MRCFEWLDAVPISVQAEIMANGPPAGICELMRSHEKTKDGLVSELRNLPTNGIASYWSLFCLIHKLLMNIQMSSSSVSFFFSA